MKSPSLFNVYFIKLKLTGKFHQLFVAIWKNRNCKVNFFCFTSWYFPRKIVLEAPFKLPRGRKYKLFLRVSKFENRTSREQVPTDMTGSIEFILNSMGYCTWIQCNLRSQAQIEFPMSVRRRMNDWTWLHQTQLLLAEQ